MREKVEKRLEDLRSLIRCFEGGDIHLTSARKINIYREIDILERLLKDE